MIVAVEGPVLVVDAVHRSLAPLATPPAPTAAGWETKVRLDHAAAVEIPGIDAAMSFDVDTLTLELPMLFALAVKLAVPGANLAPKTWSRGTVSFPFPPGTSVDVGGGVLLRRTA